MDLYEDRKGKDRVSIVELKDWECFRHWERIDNLIKAAARDLERWSSCVPGSIGDRQLNGLSRSCVRLHLEDKVYRGRGISILGYDFKYYDAAIQFISAID